MTIKPDLDIGSPDRFPVLLDTDVCVGWLRQKPGVLSWLRARSPADLAVATMTVAELRYGALLSREPEENLNRVEAILESGIAILAFDHQAAERHAELRLALRHKPVGERDLIIASTAQAHGYGVMTGNRREFDRVPGLSVKSVPKS